MRIQYTIEVCGGERGPDDHALDSASETFEAKLRAKGLDPALVVFAQQYLYGTVEPDELLSRLFQAYHEAQPLNGSWHDEHGEPIPGKVPGAWYWPRTAILGVKIVP